MKFLSSRQVQVAAAVVVTVGVMAAAASAARQDTAKVDQVVVTAAQAPEPPGAKDPTVGPSQSAARDQLRALLDQRRALDKKIADLRKQLGEPGAVISITPDAGFATAAPAIRERVLALANTPQGPEAKAALTEAAKALRSAADALAKSGAAGSGRMFLAPQGDAPFVVMPKMPPLPAMPSFKFNFDRNMPAPGGRAFGDSYSKTWRDMQPQFDEMMKQFDERMQKWQEEFARRMRDVQSRTNRNRQSPPAPDAPSVQDDGDGSAL